MLERDWKPGPEWQRITGGWRHPDGRRLSDWIPRESNDVSFQISPTTGGLVVVFEKDDPRPSVHFTVKNPGQAPPNPNT